jgi:carbon-monoxide dehydrogenase small subunit
MDGKAVYACSRLAIEADNKKILTIEGLLRGGKLHPLQQSFHEHYAAQCGFCTPGMLMSAKALLDKKPKPTREEIVEAISGNLCRCGSYQEIVEAIEAVAQGQRKE